MEKKKTIMEELSNGTHNLPIEPTMEHVFKHNAPVLKEQMQAIREESLSMKPKGIGNAWMKVASIPQSVYDMIIQKYGRYAFNDPKWMIWFLEKHPHFKYFPSARIGRVRE